MTDQPTATSDRAVQERRADGRMLYLNAMSPIHTGTGQAVDTIDLPIARERITNWPYIPGSSVKGVLRGASESVTPPIDKQILDLAFGPENVEYAGGLWFADARLLCLPVRSLAGSFAWITCPLVLHRWRRDHQSSGLAAPVAQIPDPALEEILLAEPEMKTLVVENDSESKVFLEDIDLVPRPSDPATTTAEHIASACFPSDTDWQAVFLARFGIVHNDVFSFLSETGTEISARIKLRRESKTVEDGGLWYEEALPSESILSCPVVASRQGAALANANLDVENGAEVLLGVVDDGIKRPIQIGGNASVGRGLIQAQLVPVVQP